MRVRSGFGTVVLAALLLAGCTPTAPAGGGTTETPDAGPEPTTTPTTDTPIVREFRMPTTCAEIVTAETAAQFEADGRQLLGGPGGVYGENYFGDPTPEEQAGGISCVWGDESAPATTVIVSVAPVTAGTRATIVSSLLDSGLIESQIEGALSYARIGDDVSAPGELHVLRNESWISVIEAVGGEERFQHATELVDEVTAQVYVSR